MKVEIIVKPTKELIVSMIVELMIHLADIAMHRPLPSCTSTVDSRSSQEHFRRSTVKVNMDEDDSEDNYKYNTETNTNTRTKTMSLIRTSEEKYNQGHSFCIYVHFSFLYQPFTSNYLPENKDRVI